MPSKTLRGQTLFLGSLEDDCGIRPEWMPDLASVLSRATDGPVLDGPLRCDSLGDLLGAEDPDAHAEVLLVSPREAADLRSGCPDCFDRDPGAGSRDGLQGVLLGLRVVQDRAVPAGELYLWSRPEGGLRALRIRVRR